MLTGEEGQMPWLAKALCRAGFHESDVEKIFSQNALCVFKEWIG